ncbi:MAG: transcription termination/antitermination protein NusG [Clostridiales bacterium]|nr:transcription termination/antitermination protein NusG [Clostridiales bacterium]MDR2751449.1 transcription termination/antitermination protein NusG [Clostridiales bacterium]
MNWYVVHTFSGYENKVKANIERIVENRRLHDVILEVAVPVQETIEIVKGREKKIQHKIYPGYVFLHMKMNGDTWYIIRNTRGVTGFVGPESKYVPLSEAEVQKMGLGVHDSVETSKVARLAEGDVVRILGGPFDQSIGTIQEVNALKGTATVDLAVFGRITTLELDLSKITKEVVKS